MTPGLDSAKTWTAVTVYVSWSIVQPMKSNMTPAKQEVAFSTAVRCWIKAPLQTNNAIAKPTTAELLLPSNADPK